MIGSTHDLLIVLHDHDSITQGLQFFEDMDESFGVSGVETDTRFIEDIERAHQTASKACGEVDALALTARECIRETVEREIAKSHI